jgi:hypothetical protein
MATYAGAAAIILAAIVVGLGWRRRGQRIAALQHELDDVYQAQRILARAQARKDRNHLKLLAIPLAWLVGRLHAAPARLAAATAVSAMVTGASVVSVDSPVHAPRTVTPPAAAETVSEPVQGAPLEYPSAVAPPAAAAAMVAAEVSQTPAASAAVEVETASAQSPPMSSPSTTTTTSTTTTSTTSTTLPEVVVARVCVNPVPADLHLCLVE